MSNIMAILTAVGRTGTRMRRTIRHSPEFPGPETETRDGRPATRIPAGGFLTG